MTASVRLVLTIAVTACAAAAFGADDADREKLQGRWKVVEATPDDQAAKECIGSVAVFGRERMFEEIAEEGNKKAEGSKYRLDPTKGLKYRLDPTKKPKHIDILADKNDNANFDDAKENFVKGIYEIEGHRLKLCFAA